MKEERTAAQDRLTKRREDRYLAELEDIEQENRQREARRQQIRDDAEAFREQRRGVKGGI